MPLTTPLWKASFRVLGCMRFRHSGKMDVALELAEYQEGGGGMEETQTGNLG